MQPRDDDDHGPTAAEPATPRPGRRPSFRVVLFLVILPQIALATALTAWLAYRGAVKSVEDVAVLLREETTQRIQDRLGEYFGLAPVITRLNEEYIQAGQSDVDDLESLGIAFWKQLQVFDSLGWITFGRADGGYLSLQRPDGELIEIETKVGDDAMAYELRSDGTRGELLRVNPGYDPTVRPWYQRAIEAGELVWADPYQWLNIPHLCVDAVAPVYSESGEVLGVLDTGFSLRDISSYLAGLRIGQSGRTFIIERTGELVASSAGRILAPQPDGELARVAAANSDDALVRAAARQLAEHHPDLTGLEREVGLDFELGDARVYLQAAPLGPGTGLDWVIVVAVPDAAFMTHIDATVEQTVLGSLAAMAIALVLSLLVTRWLARPLIDLARRARRIQHGDLDVRFIPRSRDEIGVLTQTMGDMVEGLRERERIRDAFGRYVHEDLAHEVLSDPNALAPGGTLQTVTILMSDLRGFSVFTARLGPSGTVSLLNVYLSRMTRVIAEYGGFVNDFIGDAILAVFGAPQTGPDDAERAMRCALAMQVALDELNRESAETGVLERGLEMGIGLDTGDVIIGNIGGEQRVKYGVIGDAVNMAARIESLTIGGQILVSRHTLEQAPEAFDVGPPITVKVKGRDDALTIHELLGARAEPELRVRGLDESAMHEVDLRADLWVLSGKSVADRPREAVVTRLGERAVELVTDEQLEPLQNVKLRLQERGHWKSGWYAKVRSVENADGNGDADGAQRAVVALTHEAERTLEEKLRDRLIRALANGPERAAGHGAGESGERPRGAFLEQLAAAPIESPQQRRVASRILVEMAAADGVLKPSERDFISHFVKASDEQFEALMALDPLTRSELRRVPEGPIRDTLLMLAWATALCDTELADEEVHRLAELATGLAIGEGRALELRDAAQVFLSDAAFDIVWPSDEEPTEPDRGLANEYTTLISKWAPDYGAMLDATLRHVPNALRPQRVLELGCATGNLTERLLATFPGAELHVVGRSEAEVTRCRRRFPDAELVLYWGELTSVEAGDEPFDLVASSLALHHLDNAGKREVFERARGWLREGGVFTYSDIFLGASNEIQSQQLAQWRRSAVALGSTESQWADLMARREEADRSARLDAQLQWLDQAGFSVVECTWKHGLWTQLLAIR